MTLAGLGGQIQIDAQGIQITSLGRLTVRASTVFLNGGVVMLNGSDYPIARAGDFSNWNPPFVPLGTIVTGATTVLTGGGCGGGSSAHGSSPPAAAAAPIQVTQSLPRRIGDYSLEVSDSGITLAGPGGRIVLDVLGVLIESAGTVDFNAASTLALSGAVITLNGSGCPIARAGDLLNGSFVLGRSPTVFTSCAGWAGPPP